MAAQARSIGAQQVTAPGRVASPIGMAMRRCRGAAWLGRDWALTAGSVGGASRGTVCWAECKTTASWAGVARSRSERARCGSRARQVIELRISGTPAPALPGGAEPAAVPRAGGGGLLVSRPVPGQQGVEDLPERPGVGSGRVGGRDAAQRRLDAQPGDLHAVVFPHQEPRGQAQVRHADGVRDGQRICGLGDEVVQSYGQA